MRKVFILDTCITQTQQSIKNQLMRFTLMGNNLTPMWVNTVAPPASTFVICSEGRNISIRYSRDKASILINELQSQFTGNNCTASQRNLKLDPISYQN